MRFLFFVLWAASGCSLTELDHLGAGGASASTAGTGGAGGISTTASGGGMPSGYRGVVLRDNPIAYWRLGEALGEPVASDEMGTYDASYIGVITQGAPGAITGDDDTAVDFSTEGGRGIQLADTASLSFEGLAAMSLEVWIAPNRVDSVYRRILSKEPFDDTTVAEGYYLTLHETEGLVWSRQHDGVYDGIGTDPPSLDEYHHVVATFDGMAMYLYVDGELASSRLSQNVLGETPTPFTMGGKSNTLDGVYSGRLDEVAVYDYALPGVVVVQHYLASQMPR